MRPSPLLLLALLAALPIPVRSQEDAAEPAVVEVSANARMAQLMTALKAAEEGSREQALAQFIDGAVSTSALFAGQYAGLGELEWETAPLLMSWLKTPPKNLSGNDPFRSACVNALRDTVTEASPEMLTALKTMADDVLLPQRVRQSIVYATAQFGDRERVDKMLETAAQNAKAADPNTRLTGLNQLADIRYNLREYDQAATAYATFVEALTALAPHYQGLGTITYNTACSHALAGETDKAFDYLERALATGARLRQPLPKSLLETDMDIASLRDDERFAALMKKHFPENSGEAPAEDGSGKK